MSFLPSFDRRLVGRIKKHMADHRRVTLDGMAEELQQLYRQDYGRRKKGAFKKLVKQVHGAIVEDGKKVTLSEMERKHLAKRRKEDSGHSSSSSDSIDEDCLVEYPHENSMNSSLMSLYKKKRRSHSTPSSPFRYYNHPALKAEEEKSVEIKSVTRHFDEKLDTSGLMPVEDEIDIKTEKFHFQNGNNMENLTGKAILSNVWSKDGEIETNLPESTKTSKMKSRKLRKLKAKKHSETEEQDIDIKGKDAAPTFTLQASNVKFDSIGGNKKVLREVCKLLIHMRHPEVYKTLGVVPPRGVLLHGPPGCGKSLLASAIAGELELPMLRIAATEIVSGVSGESEQKLRDLFDMALSSAPCIIFIDEIDAITPKREVASKDMERRIVAQLLACLDNLNDSPSQILVIGATNRPDSIDPALRRAGRFDREICMGIPDEKAREDILRVLCKKLKLETDFNYSMLARLTPGFVGADLMSLCREAAMCAVNRILGTIRNKNSEKIKAEGPNLVEVDDGSRKCTISHSTVRPSTINETVAMEMVCTTGHQESDSVIPPSDLTTFELLSWLHQTSSLTDEQLEGLCISFSDFHQALPSVQPSAKREGFATVPDVTWDDVGALENIKDELAVAILAPVRNPAAFASLGLVKPPGILLAGPPGCGKTLLAKAITNESGINFISVKGPELLNMYVGESERAVRQCFERARSSAPCVIFFDELDSLCPRRSGSESSSTARVVNQMLTEMDGLESRGNVFVMAATNRPDIIDPAVLRPGRLDKTIFVGLPEVEDRLKILQTITRNGQKPPISSDVSLESIAQDERCRRFTGADLSSLIREAAVNALKDHISSHHVLANDLAHSIEVRSEHFEAAFRKVKPSVSTKDEMRYKTMKREFQG